MAATILPIILVVKLGFGLVITTIVKTIEIIVIVIIITLFTGRGQDSLEIQEIQAGIKVI
jgi:hypothetical protein